MYHCESGDLLTQHWIKVGPTSSTLYQPWTNVGPTFFQESTGDIGSWSYIDWAEGGGGVRYRCGGATPSNLTYYLGEMTPNDPCDVAYLIHWWLPLYMGENTHPLQNAFTRFCELLNSEIENIIPWQCLWSIEVPENIVIEIYHHLESFTLLKWKVKITRK